MIGAGLRSSAGALFGATVRPSVLSAPRRTLPSVLPSAAMTPTIRPAQVRHATLFAPRRVNRKKAFKGRVPVRTGGSIKGTLLTEGTYGIRALYPTRMTAAQLEATSTVIKRNLKAVKGAQMWMKVFPDIPVCVKGNESRMGGGKGAFSHWMTRVPVGHVIFEIGGPVDIKPEIAREILRIASACIPVPVEFIDKNALPRLGNMLVPKTWKPTRMLSHQDYAKLLDYSHAIPRHHLAPARKLVKETADAAVKEAKKNKDRLRLGQPLKFEAAKKAAEAAEKLASLHADGYDPKDASTAALKAVNYTAPDTRTSPLSPSAGNYTWGA